MVEIHGISGHSPETTWDKNSQGCRLINCSYNCCGWFGRECKCTTMFIGQCCFHFSSSSLMKCNVQLSFTVNKWKSFKEKHRHRWKNINTFKNNTSILNIKMLVQFYKLWLGLFHMSTCTVYGKAVGAQTYQNDSCSLKDLKTTTVNVSTRGVWRPCRGHSSL